MERMTGVSWGLLVAWAANDLEEWLTMREDSRSTLRRLPAAWPIPERVRADGLSQAHIDTAILLMGGLMAGASVDGARTGGRSPFFRATLLAFGLHGFGHLAGAARARRWTTGSRTSPTVVIPYWLWATRELRRAGVAPLEAVRWPFVAATPLAIGSVHGCAWLLRRAAGVRSPLTE